MITAYEVIGNSWWALVFFVISGKVPLGCKFLCVSFELLLLAFAADVFGRCWPSILHSSCMRVLPLRVNYYLLCVLWTPFVFSAVTASAVNVPCLRAYRLSLLFPFRFDVDSAENSNDQSEVDPYTVSTQSSGSSSVPSSTRGDAAGSPYEYVVAGGDTEVVYVYRSRTLKLRQIFKHPTKVISTDVYGTYVFVYCTRLSL